jgi:hypothetical protein
LFHEHSNTIQVFEIPHFAITPFLRMLQNFPLTRISSPRLRSYLWIEEMRVFVPQGGLILPREDHVWFEDRWMVAYFCGE